MVWSHHGGGGTGVYLSGLHPSVHSIPQGRKRMMMVIVMMMIYDDIGGDDDDDVCVHIACVFYTSSWYVLCVM